MQNSPDAWAEPLGWASSTSGRGSPGSQNKPLRAATRREALPVRRAHHVCRREGVGLRSVRAVAAALALTAAGPLVLAGCGGADTSAPRPTATVTVTPKPVALTVGFFGSAPEIAAYRQAVDNYDAANQRVTLTLKRLLAARALYLHIEGEEKVRTLEQAEATGPVEDMPVRAILRQTQTPLTIYWCP